MQGFPHLWGPLTCHPRSTEMHTPAFPDSFSEKTRPHRQCKHHASSDLCSAQRDRSFFPKVESVPLYLCLWETRRQRGIKGKSDASQKTPVLSFVYNSLLPWSLFHRALYCTQPKYLLRSTNLSTNGCLCIAKIALWIFPVAQTVKNLPARKETWVWSLGQKDPLEKGMATHSSILAWRIPWTEEPGGPQSMGSQRVRHDRVTNIHTHKIA